MLSIHIYRSVWRPVCWWFIYFGVDVLTFRITKFFGSCESSAKLVLTMKFVCLRSVVCVMYACVHNNMSAMHWFWSERDRAMKLSDCNIDGKKVSGVCFLNKRCKVQTLPIKWVHTSYTRKSLVVAWKKRNFSLGASEIFFFYDLGTQLNIGGATHPYILKASNISLGVRWGEVWIILPLHLPNVKQWQKFPGDC